MFEAGSVETNSTFLQLSTRATAVAQESDVLSTPPLQVKKSVGVGCFRTCIECLLKYSKS